MNLRPVLVLSSLSILLIALTPAMIGAQEEGLDPSFGTGGRVVTDFFRSWDEAFALAVQPDGRILAAGSVSHPGIGQGYGYDFAVARYTADGLLVPPLATVDFHPGQGLNDDAVGVAALSDGRIVLAGGTSSDRIQNDDFAAARLLPGLGLDPAFGTGGRTITDFYGNFDMATGMAVQPDGKIVVVGLIEDPAEDQDFGLIRYNLDGTLDAGFGTGGRVVTDLSPSSEIPNAVALQPDGKIVVVGATFAIAASELSMVRYLSNGTLDPSFGFGGKVFLNSYTAHPRAVAVQPDGRIVAAGLLLTGPQESDFVLWRFESDGRLDAGFGNGGRVITDFGRWEDAHAVALQPDGKIVAAGNTQLYTSHLSSDFAVARYDADGHLDPSFGEGGLAATDFLGGGDLAHAVVIQPGRGILVGGQVGNGVNGSSDFGLARYLGGCSRSTPVITGAAASPATLWPPNHKLVDVTVGYSVKDDCDPAPVCTLSVTSNEPVQGTGDGDTGPDWEIVDAHHVRLRAERSGRGTGRVYTITLTCRNTEGASALKRLLVKVPKSGATM
jgi:uncharacterized delta-60 repeat protein